MHLSHHLEEALYQNEIDGLDNYFESLSLNPLREKMSPYPLQEINNKIKEELRVLQENYENREASFDKLLQTGAESEVESKNVLEEVQKNRKRIESEFEKKYLIVNQKKQHIDVLDSAEKNKNEHIPKLRTEYDSLVHIFSIKWDSTAPENQIKGYILRHGINEVLPFSLDSEKNSSIFIANFLWKQLGNPSSFIE